MKSCRRSRRFGASWAILALTVMGLLVGMVDLPGAGADSLAQEAIGVGLDYVLTIDDPDSGQATVTLTVSNLTGDTFEVEEHGYHGLYVYVLELSAYDSNGDTLPVEHSPDSGSTYFGQRADVWRIQCQGLSQIAVEYTVQPGLELHRGDEHRGYIASDFAALAGEYVFLVPRGSATNSVAVSFSLPSGWISYAPWPRQGDVYDPTIPEANVIDSLCVSDFALGQFDVYTQTIGATEVAVAAYHDWSTDTKEGLAECSWDIFEYQASVFGGPVGDYYLAIFCPVASDDQDIYIGEWSTSQGYSIRFESDGSYWGQWDMFAHQVFHRWNGWAWGMWGYHSWFGEGPNVFYEMKVISELRVDRPYGGMEDELQRYYDTYINDYVGSGNDQALASWDLDTFLVYRKGAMVAFLIAKEIYLRTDGAHNFDDFLHHLVDNYGHYATRCTEECLKAELATLTGTDFTQFFDDYVYGTATLPMDWAFEDSDGDGLSNALEIGWDTHPEDADTDGDGYGDATEVAGHSDPLDPCSIPLLVHLPVVASNHLPPTFPITIDGEGEDWQSYTPAFSDPQGDTTGGPHTDLQAIYAQTGPNHAYLMIEAYDPSLLSEATIELNMDLVDNGGGTRELHTNIRSDGSFYAWTDDDGDGNWERYPISAALTAWANVMELRLPLRQLGSPSLVRPTFATFWCDVDGQWTWVDRMAPTHTSQVLGRVFFRRFHDQAVWSHASYGGTGFEDGWRDRDTEFNLHLDVALPSTFTPTCMPRASTVSTTNQPMSCRRRFISGT